jgi:hypothetical protein
VPDDELMRFKIGLDGYDDFFEQSLNLGKYKEPGLNRLKG